MLRSPGALKPVQCNLHGLNSVAVNTAHIMCSSALGKSQKFQFWNPAHPSYRTLISIVLIPSLDFTFWSVSERNVQLLRIWTASSLKSCRRRSSSQCKSVSRGENNFLFWRRVWKLVDFNFYRPHQHIRTKKVQHRRLQRHVWECHFSSRLQGVKMHSWLIELFSGLSTYRSFSS